MSLSLEFCGEWFSVDPNEAFIIGREGPLRIEDNPYLHRRFLAISCADGLWWMENVGSRLSATVADSEGATQAYLQPGARLPLVYASTNIIFTAGPTTYEMQLLNDTPAYTPTGVTDSTDAGETTIGPIELTPSQLLLVLALAEPVLTGRGTTSSIPSSQVAAKRLGWPITRFNRKLDHVCERLTRYGVRGLHGGPEKLAVNRRARLVEHAVATRLVTSDDLFKLDDPSSYDDASV
ncbi:hypothetical protein [Changpingibacter yushuensis]|uniref:hypothetical protein n=1 Tax=Changpingibacter yushuensis TaxID=2758440 RepID=UPI00165EB975|nr:hypothetical protein [Changpingibacter yushuensis]